MISLLPGRTNTRDANRTVLGKRGTFGNSGLGCDGAAGDRPDRESESSIPAGRPMLGRTGSMSNNFQDLDLFTSPRSRSAVQPTRPKRRHHLLSGCHQTDCSYRVC
jgi:hypothetical protein